MTTYPTQRLITSSYLHKLASVYQLISNRGVLVDVPRLRLLTTNVENKITALLGELSTAFGRHVYIGAEHDDGTDTSMNLNCSNGERSLVNRLKELGFTPPVIRKRMSDGNTKWFESKESANNEALYKIFSDTGDPNIEKIMHISHLKKLLTSKLHAPLWNNTMFSSYNVSRADTGRRTSSTHIFDLGDNMQNISKHDRYGLGYFKEYRRCLIARPGKLFFTVDQCSAEEWPVSALAEDTDAIKELEDAAAGIGDSRHAKLASRIFNLSIEQVSNKDCNEYYIGKKARHANNYSLQAKTFSSQCAANNISLSEISAKIILDKVNQLNPKTHQVFHEYIKQQLYNTRTLTTPFGRERIFFGLKPNDNNYDIFTKAFAQIPQSTVGDNTGLAVFSMFQQAIEQQHSFDIVHEGHDSGTNEVSDSLDDCIRSYNEFTMAFNRKIIFHNGIEVEIPIEGELAYNFTDSVKIKHWTPEGVAVAYAKLQELKQQQLEQAEKDKIALLMAQTQPVDEVDDVDDVDLQGETIECQDNYQTG